MNADSQSLAQARTTLQSVFGYSEFRPGQEEIITAALEGRDTLGVLPTGAGKSLCYQIPALVQGACTLVISPLIALMRDQTERLRQRGIAATAIYGGMAQGEVNDAIHRASRGMLRLMYVAPERLEVKSFRELLKSIPLAFVVVDEAHCISEWGHDYRPAYRSIPDVFQHIPRVPIIAVTATATPDVRADICSNLQLQSPAVVVRGFDRPNLAFQVAITPYKTEQIIQSIRTDTTSAALVYAGSRKRVDAFAAELSAKGIVTRAYHAGKSDAERSAAQDAFLRNECNVLVATSAFGMGIDKPDIRHVFHTDLTLTLEAYYQEGGRAGRDGASAACTLIYDKRDRELMQFFIQAAYPQEREIRNVYNAIAMRSGVGIGSASPDILLMDSLAIARDVDLPVAVVDGCITMLERAGVVLRMQASGNTRVKLVSSIQRLRQFAGNAAEHLQDVYEPVIRALSSVEGVGYADIDVRDLARKGGVTVQELSSALHTLNMARLVQYGGSQTSGGLLLSQPRQVPSALHLPVEDIARRRDHAVRKLDVMVRYAEERSCKRNFILAYFGDPDIVDVCGRCSSCVTSSVPVAAMPDDVRAMATASVEVVYQLANKFGRQVVADVLHGVASEKVQQYGMSRCVAWNRYAGARRQEILFAIDTAVHAGWIAVSSSMYPTLGITKEGGRLVGPGVLPLDLWSIKRPLKNASAGVMRALTGWRQQVAGEEGVAPQSLISLAELERIAQDMPMDAAELVAGRHGSRMFVEGYGARIVAVLRGFSSVPAEQPRNAGTEAVTLGVRPEWDLLQAAQALGRSPAVLAGAIQKAVEQGTLEHRGNLVPESVYADVVRYLRRHPYAKLRHIRENVEADVDMTVLRCALAFARRELFGGDL